MKIKILVSCSGNSYSFAQGETVNIDEKTAKDLINAKYAEEVPHSKSKLQTKEGD